MEPREKRYFKEIIGLLLIKFCLIILIGIVFFSQPENRPDSVSATSAHLLGVPAPATRALASENRSSYDQ